MNEALIKTAEDNIHTANNEAIRDFIRISALQRIECIKPYFADEDLYSIKKYLETGDEFYKKDALYPINQLAYSEDFFSGLPDATKETISMILLLEIDDKDFKMSVESSSCSNGTISISWH